ncbi:hypothetical protein G6F37_011357 [Rhizopus arrhizus]|nr:hypothetical protein G6F38_010589 [Rhizopus arrhizus]KAG1149733.1 hypothetical protein G6F37_011357 [Rhizopus arrhizus]
MKLASYWMKPSKVQKDLLSIPGPKSDIWMRMPKFMQQNYLRFHKVFNTWRQESLSANEKLSVMTSLKPAIKQLSNMGSLEEDIASQVDEDMGFYLQQKKQQQESHQPQQYSIRFH